MKPKPSLGVPSRIFDRFAALRVLDRIPRFGSISITGAAELPRFYQNRSVTYVSEHVSHMSPVHTVRRGGCASKKWREATEAAQTGWSKRVQTRIPKYFRKLTTPSAPSKVASQYLLDVASTPPHEEGSGHRPRLQRWSTSVDQLRHFDDSKSSLQRERSQLSTFGCFLVDAEIVANARHSVINKSRLFRDRSWQTDCIFQAEHKL